MDSGAEAALWPVQKKHWGSRGFELWCAAQKKKPLTNAKWRAEAEDLKARVPKWRKVGVARIVERGVAKKEWLQQSAVDKALWIELGKKGGGRKPGSNTTGGKFTSTRNSAEEFDALPVDLLIPVAGAPEIDIMARDKKKVCMDSIARHYLHETKELIRSVPTAAVKKTLCLLATKVLSKSKVPLKVAEETDQLLRNSPAPKLSTKMGLSIKSTLSS